jgi:hypothetical protein
MVPVEATAVQFPVWAARGSPARTTTATARLTSALFISISSKKTAHSLSTGEVGKNKKLSI